MKLFNHYSEIVKFDMLVDVSEKLLIKKTVDDIDLAANLNPKKFVRLLKKKYKFL